jgi:phosphoribosylaminoimidazole-succinocarboxamide synthase
LREWLETTSWDKNSPPPPLPDEVVAGTRQKYIEGYEKLTGKRFVVA